MRGTKGVLLALLVLICVVWPKPVVGQACCASASLVAPTRLRSYEDFAMGFQGRARSAYGAFDATGAYARTANGESDWSFEQDLFAVARVFDAGQIALSLPFVQTRRTVPGAAEVGGGLGDLLVSARYDFVLSGVHRRVPGLALLTTVQLPTGTAPEDDAAGDLGAGVTGTGSMELTAGIAVEQAFDPYFVTVNALGTYRRMRTVGAIRESFAPRWTFIGAVGRVFGRATGGLFLNVTTQGDNHDGDGSVLAGSATRAWMPGVAGTWSFGDEWRLQGTSFANLPVGGAGRNQSAGVGISLAIMRLWL